MGAGGGGWGVGSGGGDDKRRTVREEAGQTQKGHSIKRKKETEKVAKKKPRQKSA